MLDFNVVQLTNLSLQSSSGCDVKRGHHSVFGIRGPTSLSEPRVKDALGIVPSDLPNELLSAIFENLIPERGTSHHPHPERILAKVCKKWRSIAVQTPAFWATISVVPHESIQLIKTYLGRSCDRPLDISLDSWRDAGIWKGPLKQRLAVLASSSQRWHSLLLTNMGSRNIQLVLSRVNNLGYLPQLRHLTVDKRKAFALWKLRNCFPYIAAYSAPTLTAMGIVTAGHCTSSFFNSLTHLTLTTHWSGDYVIPSWRRFKQLLLSFPNLEYLRLEGVVVKFDLDAADFEFTDCPHYGVVDIPTLHTFILQPYTMEQLHCMLSGIFAPRLRHLELFHPFGDEMYAHKGDTFWDDADTYLYDVSGNTKFPQVTTLVLNNCTDHTVVRGINFLGAFPKVEHIQLVEHDIATFSLMLSMEMESGSTESMPLLAQLKSITLSRIDEDVADEELLRMLFAIEAWSRFVHRRTPLTLNIHSLSPTTRWSRATRMVLERLGRHQITVVKKMLNTTADIRYIS
ncbi:uncharacterized protein EDB91DRAFT_488393 [Suillus paluster]|uniref:uncharacterized protein n=1 Tax=Suillus paluster TaxID=48578 RepID=UPI001B885C89|nr:uncharacterized protein EDB91DRAFT_488393 [Suillus paluster]KAG1737076.1 hypothetical protein EDB91DRAFT_488393 [Suillus paluster]